MAKQPNDAGTPLPDTGESLADFQKRKNEAAFAATGSSSGDQLVVEPPTLKSVVGHQKDKHAKASEPPKKSPRKGK